MTEGREDAVPQAQAASQPAPAADDRGWYLYGITRRGAVGTIRPERGDGDRGAAESASAPGGDEDEGEPLQVLDCGALATIVRRVPLAQFSEEALRAHGDDTAWIAEMARRHNQVIAAIHQEQAILPAKFGSVYARAEDVLTAVAGAHDALLAQLERVEGCDEWAVHVYADRAAIEQRVAAAHQTIQQLQQEIAAASRGRAYLLQRRLDEERAAATDQALSELAQAHYEHLARGAVVGQVTQPTRSASEAHDESEVLRAAFLVQRARADAFLVELRSCVEGGEGVRCEYSGPWPPYSFAVLTEEEAP
jgi:Gas vesicle synthesis protein GvpL/GvpF